MGMFGEIMYTYMDTMCILFNFNVISPIFSAIFVVLESDLPYSLL
jgi:hypothetical protein